MRVRLTQPHAGVAQGPARQHQIATTYQYWASVGISFRFGSIFDNVVNQRLENTLGGL